MSRISFVTGSGDKHSPAVAAPNKHLVMSQNQKLGRRRFSGCSSARAWDVPGSRDASQAGESRTSVLVRIMRLWPTTRSSWKESSVNLRRIFSRTFSRSSQLIGCAIGIGIIEGAVIFPTITGGFSGGPAGAAAGMAVGILFTTAV